MLQSSTHSDIIMYRVKELVLGLIRVLFISVSENESSIHNRDWTVIQPSCINDLPEKLLMSGITFPGKIYVKLIL